ncbi:MAG: nickel pincer cofactor biosynthesis protein LarC [Deltaproteobacteria bacterium]|nr:MAG: nickel pincer cofactor biosynthesis protein LarC [Deltaproteobacteria bacterium]
MSVLWLDPVGGIAGDMTLAALLDLGVDPDTVREGLGGLAHLGFRLQVGETERHGIRARTVAVLVDGRREGPGGLTVEAGEALERQEIEHGDVGDGGLASAERKQRGHTNREHAHGGHTHGEHAHGGHAHGEHAHGEHAASAHGHGGPTQEAHGHGRTWGEIRALLQAAGLPTVAEAVALEAFERLAHAEAAVHGTTPEAVHFHEVGAVDAIVDIAGVAVAYAALGAPEVLAGPPPLGRGFVHTAHGHMPVPAPATLELLRGVEVAPASTEGELTTPTGAALLRTLAGDRVGSMPSMRPERIGYGAGQSEFEDRPNLLRAVLGARPPAEARTGEVLVVETNLDDLPAELLAAAVEALFAAGALDVVVVPAFMKKGRPGHLLQVLCHPEEEAPVVEALFRETPTLGVRLHRVARRELSRRVESVATPWGPVPVKVGRLAEEALTHAPEYEACRRLARAAGVPVRAVYEAALAAALRREGGG